MRAASILVLVLLATPAWSEEPYVRYRGDEYDQQEKKRDAILQREIDKHARQEDRRYYKTDARQMKVLELSNLTDGTDCHPDQLVGRVVKLKYDDELAVSITGVTIQSGNGDRSFLNVDPPYDGLDMVTRGWIGEGLRTLLKVGKKVRIGFYLCGAAGRIWHIHSIRPAR